VVKPIELRPTDLLLIRHVALYRMTFNEAAQRIVFPADDYGGHTNAIKLTGEGLTALCRGDYLRDQYLGERMTLPGQRKYYTIGPEAKNVVGDLSENALKPPGPQALALDLAVNWFCNMKSRLAHRLTTDDLRSVYPQSIPFAQNVVHCLREERGMAVVYRIYLATAKSPKRSAEQVGLHIKNAWQTEQLRPLVESGEYGFSVLVPTPQAGKGVREAVSKKLESLKRTITESVSPRVTVELAPVPATVGIALREYKQHQ